ncbi:MAG: insulinase family protein [Clostridia bacterium]|nr:insulinase family protein [Clostridia bacterium]
MEQILRPDAAIRDQFTLPNGLRVIGERMPFVRTVSVGVFVHTGSMMESPEEEGLSHFMEHMVFKGTFRRSTRQQAEEMDACGGQINAFTGKDATVFYCKVIDSDIALAFDMLSDMTRFAALDPQELEKEKGVIIEEIAMDQDDPETLCCDLLGEKQWEGTRAEHSILGTKEQIRGYSSDDLRAFRDRHYSPDRIVLSLAGNYDPEMVRDLAEEWFGSWEKGQAQDALPLLPVRDGVIYHKTHTTEQVHLCLGYPAPVPGDPMIHPMSVLSSVLGGAASSRLFQRIREDLGLSYNVYAWLSSMEGAGSLGIYASIGEQNLETTLREIMGCIADLKEHGIREKELQDAKTLLRAGLLMGLESTSGRMMSNGRSLLILNHAPAWETMEESIRDVTLETVQALASQTFSHEPTLCLLSSEALELPKLKAMLG